MTGYGQIRAGNTPLVLDWYGRCYSWSTLVCETQSAGVDFVSRRLASSIINGGKREGLCSLQPHAPLRLQSPANRWLVENGPNELELLFRAIVYHPSAPLLITDDDGNSRDASVGAGKLLGLPREEIIGRAGR